MNSCFDFSSAILFVLLFNILLFFFTDIACMSMEMNFKELFDHLSFYVADPEIRWKWVIRVKRGRPPAQLGGNGKDQCYFRGDYNYSQSESIKISSAVDNIPLFWVLELLNRWLSNKSCGLKQISTTVPML